MALPKQHRLGSSRNFGKVHRKGVRAATENLALRALDSRALDSRALNSSRHKLPKSKASSAHPEQHRDESADGHSSALSSRFGISISKKVSKRAVVRNRIRRRLLAIIQCHLDDIAPGWQVVIIVRPPAIECEFDDFLRELEYLLKKVKITEGFHGY